MSTKRPAVNISNGLPQRNYRQLIGELFEGLPSEELGGFDRGEYFRTSLFSKYADPSPEAERDRERRAIDKLRSVEERNITTTLRLRNRRSAFIHGMPVSSLLYTAKCIISSILGNMDVNELFHRSDFSNGASVSRLRKVASKFEKFDGGSAVSSRALPYLLALYKGSPVVRQGFLQQQLASGNWVTTDTNILFTVPKNEEINRCAAKEPDWNMFFQKGLGSMIRDRLRKVGIDLNDQTKNKRLAKLGSIDQSLATLDLSSASDSVTEQLVYELLPGDWFKHLSSLRSPLCKFPDGSIHKWVLFSTMGNGFTFELESLIFFALAKSVAYHTGTKGTISVYGDDIIVPTAMASSLVDLLGYAGFITNKDKSFITGFFRESCGGHYFKGIDVTPIYIRRPFVHIKDLVNFLNKFRKWSAAPMGEGRDGLCDPRHFEYFETLESYIPHRILKAIKGGGDMEQSTFICGPGRASLRICEPSKNQALPSLSTYLMVMFLAERSDGEARKSLPTGQHVLRPIPMFVRNNCDQVGFAWFPQELPKYV